MSKKIKFIFGFHNHQPVGNFEHVLEEGYQKAYKPLVETFLKHQQIKITWHFTGFLYDWINQHYPEMNDHLKIMVDRGQAEMMTGGYYEPILSVIPEPDRQGQIRKLTEYVIEKTGYHPTGAWLAERVWEPQLAGTFVDAGIKYTVTDDSHFLSAGLAESETWGYYFTEELGKTLAIFPINQLLRYTIPFQDPSKTIEVFKQVIDQPGDHVLVMADDGEKFGIWPGTYEHCHVKGWLHRFLEEIEKNLDWIEPITFTECLQTTAPLGRIYLPTASYTEMMEWAMPTSAILQYEQLVEDLKKQNKYEPNKHFIRGGFWRNFLVKYPESNNLHKKMLYVSHKIQQAVAKQSRSPDIKRAQDALWAGQTNCAYWHGLFGGLYLNYLRDALYRNLIQAEQLVDQVQHKTKSWIEVDQFDFDADGHQEILVNTSEQSLYFKPNYGGALFEHDIKKINFNILDTLSRKKESYHTKIVQAQLQSDNKSDQQETKSIHDLVITKEPHLEKYLFYDWYQRYSFLDHFMPIDAKLEEFSQCRYAELGDFVNQPYQVKIRNPQSSVQKRDLAKGGAICNREVELTRSGNIWYEDTQEPVKVTKRFLIPKDTSTITAEYTIQNLSQKKLHFKFGIELNLALLAGDAPDRYYYFTGKSIPDKKLNSVGSVARVAEMGLVDEWQKLDINLHFNIPAEIWRFPIETVSKSEAGFERVYQHSVVVPIWQLYIEPNQIWQTQVTKQVRVNQ